MVVLLLHSFPTLTSKCPKGRFVALRFINGNGIIELQNSGMTEGQGKSNIAPTLSLYLINVNVHTKFGLILFNLSRY